MTDKRVAIFAGGTGGHVYPALAVASELQERGYAVDWFGTERGLEARVVPQAGFPLHLIRVSGIRGKGAAARLRGLFSIGLALLQSLGLLARLRPACALGMGGYVSGPAGLAARLLWVPLVIHEQNSVAGTTNRLLRRFAAAVCTAYPRAFGASVTTRQVGNPVRAQLLAKGAADYDYDGSRPLRLLVVGGSLGAKAINEMLPQALAALPVDCAVQLRHQTGPTHAESVAALYGEQVGNVEILPYIEDMAGAYRWADLVLCRAGALTLAELTIIGRPAILVPLPNAIDDHQAHNAAWLAEAGGAIVMPQAEMTADAVAGLVAELAGAPERLSAMAHSALAAGSPAATADVADICEEVRRGR
ncbi:MAG: undecaprenyldiphospho-muramoylpentapeptide beta-N-acetylglucosaminyltransferase [Halieaceae bacterium]|nr:undecaprenyldiphospho-muramoylpentapeptide beta-N-acetylglucosaminyltransferase [Halieaceae bacterium]